MAAVDDLQFEEFGDVAISLAANPDATTISIEDPSETPKHQRGPPRASGREEDDELLGNDSDKTELLAGQKKSSPFWTFEYYQTFFDVDTYQVFDRIKGSLLPIPGKNFVRLYIRSNPDLYGILFRCTRDGPSPNGYSCSKPNSCSSQVQLTRKVRNYIFISLLCGTVKTEQVRRCVPLSRRTRGPEPSSCLYRVVWGVHVLVCPCVLPAEVFSCGSHMSWLYRCGTYQP